ncbi:uncharacterized protein LOC143293346 [Babylonia areolata]|uniref:uncharacterized protein LOC143293346 n=1 Tax=Babylonia areolata TaxID=304850 RepID=UPI003FD65C59
MASIVHSVNQSSINERQTVCWSVDDRLAVSADRDIIIMKLDVFGGQSSFKGSEVSVKVQYSVADLAPTPDPWAQLRQHVQGASPGVQREVKQRWTYSQVGKEPVASCWTSLQWSPLGLAPNNRTVLAGVTSDHRLILMGLCASGQQWVQLADLGNHLLQQQEVGQGEATPESAQQSRLSRERCDAILTSTSSNMAGLAAVQVQWSQVMEGGGGRCALLFVAMKNGDIITCRISLPCVNIDSCVVVDRRTALTDSTVCSLAWTPVSGDVNTGVLGVGYTDGRVEALCYSLDPGSHLDASPYHSSLLLHTSDHLPVSALAWLTPTQGSLTLLGSKEQTTLAQMLTVGCHSNKWAGEEERGQRWRMELGPCCQVALGNSMAAFGIAVVGDTVVMTADDHVYHLAVNTSTTEVGVRRVGETVFQHDHGDWGCVSLALSPNGALVVALFRPLFAFNHLHEDFRCPVKVHIHPVNADWDSLASLTSSAIVNDMSPALTDIMQLACHTLHREPITVETVTMVIDRLKSSPYSDCPVGWKVARYVLLVLKRLCEKKELNEQTDRVGSALQQVTEVLLCHQVRHMCQVLGQSTVKSSDVLPLHMMLHWIKWSEQRSEVIGSELISQLSAVVGGSQPEVCLLCDGDLDLKDGVTATCDNKHLFGLCCHTLAVCTAVAYQCCMTCGALALSVHTLKGIPGVAGWYNRCSLCQSFLYSTSTSIRF